jgi:hypothetical protein
LVGAGPQPPDIDTALIDTNKAGVTPAFFVRMTEWGRASCALPRAFLSASKKISRCKQLFVMMRYYAFQPAGLDIKTCVLSR